MVDVLDPLKLRELKLKNRLVMSPYGTDLATESSEVTDQHLHHYRLRAKGVGLAS